MLFLLQSLIACPLVLVLKQNSFFVCVLYSVESTFFSKYGLTEQNLHTPFPQTTFTTCSNSRELSWHLQHFSL